MNYYFIQTVFNVMTIICKMHLRITFVFSDKEENQDAMKRHLEKELALYKDVVCLVKQYSVHFSFYLPGKLK